MPKKKNFHIKIENNEIVFIPQMNDLHHIARTEYQKDIWETVKDENWIVRKNSQGTAKYIYCSRLKKTLHQVVIDYYFSEPLRKKYYCNGFIIEHLNNDGFDCRISNLYFMLRQRNKYKGDLFDQQVKTLINKVSIRIFHILKNKTFQIIVLFNAVFMNEKTNKSLETLYLLYEYDYDLVFQDAEWLVKYFSSETSLNLKYLLSYLRCKRFYIRETDDLAMEAMEANPDAVPGSIIEHKGRQFIVLGFDGKHAGFVLETPPLPDWNLCSFEK